MAENRTLQGADWHDVVEVLHTLTNTITARAHYSEGHPAIATADKLAADNAGRVLARIPEIVVALLDNEFVVCERPMPDLRDRVPQLAHAMSRHGIECIVIQNGLTQAECTALGKNLALPKDEKGRIREVASASLIHILLRFAEVHDEDKDKITGHDGAYLVPLTREVLVHAGEALTKETPLDFLMIRSLANRVVGLCNARGFRLEPRAYVRGLDGEAIHATNVALASAAMAIEAGYPESICVDLAAAALLHDVGHMFLPEDIRGIPPPLLEEKAIPVFRNHAFAGALVLLGAGCPPLWVAVALEHHRGIDGGGYPALDGKEAPHELVRMVALASFYDRKRTSIDGKATEPEKLIQEIAALEPKYFGKPLLERLVRALGVFPPGAAVELSDRTPAIVMRHYANDPWRPQVRPLRGPASGKRIELREMNGIEGRHHRSIVRGIAPPLLLPADAVVVEDEPIPSPEESWPEVVVQDEEALAAEKPAGPTSADIAVKELAHMGSMLDDLLSVGDALRGAPNPVITASPAITASPVITAPPVITASPAITAPPVITAPPITAPPQQRATMPEMAAAAAPAAPKLAPLVTNPPSAEARATIPQRPVAVPPMPKLPPLVSSPPASSRGPVSIPQPPSIRQPVSNPQPPASSRAPRVEVSRPPSEGAAPITGIPSLAVSGAALGKLSLDHRAGFVMSLVDGMSDVETIVDASGIPRAEVERILGELVASGVVKMTK